MLKKILYVFVFALAMLVSGVFAQPTKKLDVVIRDFPVDEFKPEPGDKNPVKPPFDVDIWLTGDPDSKGGGSIAGGNLPSFEGGGTLPSIDKIWDTKINSMVPLPNGKGNKEVHGFGTKGTTIPPNRKGELILTAYPNASAAVQTKDGYINYAEWDTNSTYQKLFGLPPKAYENNPFGIADPTVVQPNGGVAFVKNGFPGESSAGGIQVAPTRCFADLETPDKPRINCLNFSLKAKQPFQIAVTVYDQLGNFITQYRETVTEQEFRSVVQSPGFVEKDQMEMVAKGSSQCKKLSANNFGQEDVVTLNGHVKVNVNIYPFFADGKHFSNGVYFLKIDRVDLPYKGCVNFGGNAQLVSEPFVRYHADTKLGWMRAGDKKK